MRDSRRDRLIDELSARLARAEHVVVYGPSGIGKTTLLSDVRKRVVARGTPCVICPGSDALHDVTTALAALFPTGRAELGARRLRGLLRDAAETSPAVLLLDHVARVGTTLKGFLRSLRGTRLGIAFAVDVDGPREKARMRRWCLSHTELVVPPASGVSLRRMLTQQAPAFLGRPSRDALEQLIEGAAGRPGYVVCCLRLMRDPRYWTGQRLRVALLGTDAEVATRNGGAWWKSPLLSVASGATTNMTSGR